MGSPETRQLAQDSLLRDPTPLPGVVVRWTDDRAASGPLLGLTGDAGAHLAGT